MAAFGSRIGSLGRDTVNTCVLIALVFFLVPDAKCYSSVQNLHSYYDDAVPINYTSIASVDGDPDFIVGVQGLEQPLCFRVEGENGQAVRLLQDQETGIVVNARITRPVPGSRRTYLGAVLIVRRNFHVLVKVGRVYVNQYLFPWGPVTVRLVHGHRVLIAPTLMALTFRNQNITLIVKRHLPEGVPAVDDVDSEDNNDNDKADSPDFVTVRPGTSTVKATRRRNRVLDHDPRDQALSGNLASRVPSNKHGRRAKESHIQNRTKIWKDKRRKARATGMIEANSFSNNTSKAKTGLRNTTSKAKTGLRNTTSKAKTGLRTITSKAKTGLRNITSKAKIGIRNITSKAKTGLRNNTSRNKSGLSYDKTGSNKKLLNVGLLPDEGDSLLPESPRDNTTTVPFKSEVAYLGFYVSDARDLSHDTHGLLGQFLYKSVTLERIRRKAQGATKARMLVQKPRPHHVRATLRMRRNLVLNASSACWWLREGGEGVVDGTYNDYILPRFRHTKLLPLPAIALAQ